MFTVPRLRFRGRMSLSKPGGNEPDVQACNGPGFAFRYEPTKSPCGFGTLGATWSMMSRVDLLRGRAREGEQPQQPETAARTSACRFAIVAVDWPICAELDRSIVPRTVTVPALGSILALALRQRLPVT